MFFIEMCDAASTGSIQIVFQKLHYSDWGLLKIKALYELHTAPAV